ncbi:hybrid sensor histidine kinase/response regulator transcription factor [Algoriphagus hitonicola]|uniref:histidine kinase n=1 Tax=Algoriphagus hitonicola TaxID=435880 RepID=A0A1I2NHQ9_9BACT|nr:ATP-binding protein [Algoriphagus hitonicola]SFG02349.1 Signal transduction histidine kinase [Algoriphagus hitonicola]
MRTLILTCWLLLSLSSFAFSFQDNRAEEFTIDVLNVRRGLLSNYVTKVVSDEYNFKYFATEGGITKFDGYDFSEYKPGPTYPELENENIETLFKDREHMIWIGTKGGGLSKLDPQKNQIQSFNESFSDFSDKPLRVIAINQSKDGKIWIGTWGNGVFVLDPKTEKVTEHFQFKQPVQQIIADQFWNIWFISGHELMKFDPSEDRLIRFSTGMVPSNLIEDSQRQKIWMIGNAQRKVILASFDQESQKIQRHETGISANFVKSLGMDQRGRLWIGSWGDGLFISDEQVGNFRKINTNPQGSTAENINYSIILSIDIDENGIAWLGTSHGGALILYPNKGFNFATMTPSETLSDRNITAFLISQNGDSYKGTLTEGLYSNRLGNSYQIEKAINRAKVHTLYEYRDYLFIGTGLGLYIAKNGNLDQAQHYLPDQKITGVLVDSKERLWVGTQQSGLKMADFSAFPNFGDWLIFNENQDQRKLQNNRISQIKEDAQGRIWLGTYSGLNRFDESTQQFLSHEAIFGEKLDINIINDLLIDGAQMYLATPIGLAAVGLEEDQMIFQDFYEKSRGMVNDFVCAIEQDHAGNLWLSTTTTVTKFNPETKNFINFDREDGILINSFHSGSSFQDESGQIYFGGSNGLVSFVPDQIEEVFNVPEVVLTKLTVNNQALHVGDEVDSSVILENSIQNTSKINLNYSQNHLSLNFAVNDFFGPDNVAYAYQLKGMNKEWVELGTLNQLSFTGLPWGDYELMIRASRNNQDWSPVRSLLISIQAPPWLQWYAFVFYAAMALGIVFLIRYISLRQAKLRAELQIIQIEKEKEHELNEAKITFFTNISHEFRTPLTLILSPVTELLEQFDFKESVKEKLLLVETNSKRMLRLINQLLDFRKSEHGLLKLHLSYADFVEFSKEVYLSFQNLASQKQISYHFESNVDELTLEFDRNQMEIVLCNLLSNAFKYTRQGGKIDVRLRVESEQLTLAIEDTGIGMSAEESARVFDRFYQVQNAETSNLVGSGIGLAFSKNIVDLHEGEISIQSEKGKGTQVKILLPVETGESPSIDTQEEKVDLLTEIEIKEQGDLKIEVSPKSARILIADDHEDIRKYLRGLLEEEYEILEAEDGLAAWELINQEIPDVIISDVMMPRMDGIKLCQQVKSQITTSHIPVILLTARTSLSYEMEGLKTGAEDYITKPFNSGIVKTRVSNILENRNKLREYYLNKVRFEPDTQTATETDMDAVFIEKAIQLVNENLQNENFGIEMMVDQLFMSQSTLFRKIKSLTGLSITAFIRSVRLKKAAQIILQSNIKLSQVAYEVGFNDYKHFKKSFQQQFDCLPSEYKLKIVEKAK